MAGDSEPFLTAIIGSDEDIYVALCPEFDIASQGGSIEDALANLREAVDLFLQSATERRLSLFLQERAKLVDDLGPGLDQEAVAIARQDNEA